MFRTRTKSNVNLNRNFNMLLSGQTWLKEQETGLERFSRGSTLSWHMKRTYVFRLWFCKAGDADYSKGGICNRTGYSKEQDKAYERRDRKPGHYNRFKVALMLSSEEQLSVPRNTATKKRSSPILNGWNEVRNNAFLKARTRYNINTPFIHVVKTKEKSYYSKTFCFIWWKAPKFWRIIVTRKRNCNSSPFRPTIPRALSRRIIVRVWVSLQNSWTSFPA